MLKVRRDQMAVLQAELDGGLIDTYVEALEPIAKDEGLDDDVLRARVRRGVALGRWMEATEGFEMSAVVALTVFQDPAWADDPETAELMDHPGLSREAKLRLLITVAGAPEGDA